MAISASGPKGTGPGLDAGEAGKLATVRRPDGLLQAVLLAEAVDAAARIHDLLLARVERVAVRADFDLQVRPERRARLEGIATAASHRNLGVLRVNGVFHGDVPVPWSVGSRSLRAQTATFKMSPDAPRRRP